MVSLTLDREMISSGFEGSIAVLEAEFDQVSPPELLKQFEEAMMLSALRYIDCHKSQV